MTLCNYSLKILDCFWFKQLLGPHFVCGRPISKLGFTIVVPFMSDLLAGCCRECIPSVICSCSPS